MPTREAVNEHRRLKGHPELSEEEFLAIMHPPASPGAEPPSGESIAHKMGLLTSDQMEALKEHEEKSKKKGK